MKSTLIKMVRATACCVWTAAILAIPGLAEEDRPRCPDVIGFLVGGKDMRLFGCSFYCNRKMTNLDDLTAIATVSTNASALVHGGLFPKCAPHVKISDGPGRVDMRDCLYPWWEASAIPGK